MYSRGIMRRSGKIIGFVLLGAALFALAAFAGYFVSESAEAQAIVERFGYLGIVFISYLSGLNFAVPIHATAFVPIYMSVFPLPGIIIAIIIGTTLADMTSYLFGYLGRRHTQVASYTWHKRISAIAERHRKLVYPLMFLWASFMPLPNEIPVISLSLLGYRLLPLSLVLVLGNIVHMTLLSLGVANVFELVL